MNLTTTTKNLNLTDSVNHDHQDGVMMFYLWHTILHHTHTQTQMHAHDGDDEVQLFVKRQTLKLRLSERRQWRAVTSAGGQGIFLQVQYLTSHGVCVCKNV